MGGRWWRLLAAFLLILVSGSRGQDGAGGRKIVPAPNYGLLRYAPLGAPVSLLPLAGSAGYQAPGSTHDGYPFVYGPIGFPQIVQRAGIIFSGTVASIERDGSPKGPQSASVTFKVERAIRGTSAGQNLTIHEWAGLWGHGERYRVGERVFLFLYPPSRLGLTSPVAGPIGRFAVDSIGRILPNVEHIRFLSTDPILGGKTVLSYDDLEQAVQRCKREE